MSHVAAKPVRSQRNNLIAAIASIAVCDIAFGLAFPFLLDEPSVPAWIYASHLVLLFASGGRLVRAAA